MYKNQCHSLYLFKIVFQVFPQVIKVWKTVNKFHPNLICLLINEILNTFNFLVNKGDLLLKLKYGRNIVRLLYLKKTGTVTFSFFSTDLVPKYRVFWQH